MKQRYYILIILTLFTLLCGMSLYINTKISKMTKIIDNQEKLTNALLDTMKIIHRENGEMLAMKLSLQSDMKTLNGLYSNLSNNQKELIDRVKGIDKSQKIIGAALIETQFKIDQMDDKLTQTVVVNSEDSTVKFTHNSDSLRYDISIINVLPSSTFKLPTLKFNEFTAPNKYFVSFQWDDNKRKNYPVSFSITNTNPLFKTINIDSYVIPELNKIDITPNFWEKLHRWGVENKRIVSIGGITIGAGGIILGTIYIINNQKNIK